jgi:hypothetical protein
VLREVLSALLGLLALGHVARGEHDSADAGMIEQIVAERLEVDPGAIGAPEAELHGLRGRAALHQVAERVPRAHGILGVHRVERHFADQRPRGVAQDARRRRRLVQSHALTVVYGDDVVRMLDQGPEGFVVFLE